MSGMVRRLEQVRVVERADWAAYESTGLTLEQLCFGRPPAEVSEAGSAGIALTADLFRQQVWLLGEALRADLDEVVTDHETAVTATDVPLAGGATIRAGTVNAQRFVWRGRAAGVDRVVIEAQWTVGPAEVDWPRTPHGWTVVLEGDPSLQAHLLTLASVDAPRSLAGHVRAASVATAMQAVNAVPYVVAAPPGLVTAADLPGVRSLAGFAPAAPPHGARP